MPLVNGMPFLPKLPGLILPNPPSSASYATMNPLDAVSGAVFMWGNLIVDAVTTSGIVRSTKSLGSGRYYWEQLTLTDVSLISDYGYSGLCNKLLSLTTTLGTTVNGLGIFTQTGAITLNGSTLATIGASKLGGDVCQIAVDTGALRLWARINGTGNWNNDASANPATGVNGLDISSIPGALYPCVWVASDTKYDYGLNLGALSFKYAVPNGFGGVPA